MIGFWNDFHPVLNLFQLYFDSADPLTYGRGLIWNRPDGMSGLHILQTYGPGDSYTPNRTIRELAMAIGLPVLTPVLDDYPRSSVDPPVSGNISVGGNSYTCVLGQYSPPEGTDGHFVIFNNETARSQMLGFLETLVTDGVPTVPEP